MKKKVEKEVGLSKSVSREAKKLDEKMDKAKKVKEGSPADLKMDKKIMQADRKAKSEGRKIKKSDLQEY